MSAGPGVGVASAVKPCSILTCSGVSAYAAVSIEGLERQRYTAKKGFYLLRVEIDAI